MRHKTGAGVTWDRCWTGGQGLTLLAEHLARLLPVDEEDVSADLEREGEGESGRGI